MSIKYDTPCWNCGGSGQGNDGACGFCDGYGHQTTDEGDALIKFLQRRGVAFPMSPRAQEDMPETRE